MKNHIGAFALGLIIIAAAVIGFTAIDKLIATGRVVQAIGGASRQVQADTVTFTATLVPDEALATEAKQLVAMTALTDKIKSVLIGKGVAAADISVATSEGGTTYLGNTTITVTTTNLALFESLDLAKELGAPAPTVSTQLAYSLSSAALRAVGKELVADAVADAQSNAFVIAKNSGKELGALQSSTDGTLSYKDCGVDDQYSSTHASKCKEVILDSLTATYGI